MNTQLSVNRWYVTPRGWELSEFKCEDENCTIFLELCAYRNESPFTLKKFDEILANYVDVLTGIDEQAFVEAARTRLPEWIKDMTQRGYLQCYVDKEETTNKKIKPEDLAPTKLGEFIDIYESMRTNLETSEEIPFKRRRII